MAKSKLPWPSKYNVGPRNHLHALGVISNNYNEFEAELFALFLHHLCNDEVPIPQNLAEKFYFSATENKRLEFIQQTYNTFEKDPVVIKCVEDLIAYFTWCAEIRNNLIHAKHANPFFFIQPATKLHLSKRNKKGSTLNYMQLSLPHLRRIADQIRAGYDWCNELVMFLYSRDMPAGRRESPVALALAGLVSLPKIPAPPKPLKLLQTPHIPEVPEYLRKPSPEKP